jgi:hypothetical protein
VGSTHIVGVPSTHTEVQSGATLGEAGVAPGASCKPNISPRGRRRRRRFGFEMTGVTLVMVGVSAALDLGWYWRALAGVPASLAAVGFLQARHNTCIARAAEGTFENDDYSKVPAPRDEVAASRDVARTIRRDAGAVGLVAAAIAAATALIR